MYPLGIATPFRTCRNVRQVAHIAEPIIGSADLPHRAEPLVGSPADALTAPYQFLRLILFVIWEQRMFLDDKLSTHRLLLSTASVMASKR